MKTKKMGFVLGCLLLVAFAASAFFKQNNNEGNKNKSFTVVELFTSEGCSSCPSADALVAKVQAETTTQPIYILAFHVDYWDRLGWKDAFSSADFSKRQRQYADWLKLESVYTPQIVVNGQKEFVGSQESSLHNAITASMQNTASAQLAISNLKIDKTKASLQYTAENSIPATTLVIAVVQKKAVTNVKRGENGGRTLAHVQIVRNVETIPLTGKNNGTATIDLPPNLNAPDMEIIAFLQNSATGKIIAATKAAF